MTGEGDLDSGRDGVPGQGKQTTEAEKNRKAFSKLWFMEKFGKLFNPVCCKGHLYPMSTNNREVCIFYHSIG